MTKYTKETIIGAVVAAFGAFMYAGSHNIKVMRLSKGAVSSAVMPRLCAGILIFLGLAMIAANLYLYMKNRKPAAIRTQRPPPEKTGAGGSRQGLARLGGMVLLLFLYCLLFDKIGFIISSTLFLFLSILLLAPPPQRKWLPSVIAALIVPVAVYYLFAKAFYMLLPGGLL